MKRLFFTILVLMLLVPAGVRAETPSDMAREAQQAFQDKNYSEAAKKWQELINLGFVNGNIYYNLSHAYWQMGEPGNALRYLLMGSRWKPRDGDIYNNLQYVGEKMSAGSGGGGWRLWLREHLLRHLTLNYYEKFFLLAVVSFCFFGLLIRSKIRKRRAKKRWIIPLGLLWVILLVFWGQAYYENFWLKQGVVLKPDTALLSAPTLEAATGKNLKEGQLVRVEKRQGEFQLVKTPSGEGGWVQSSQLGLVE